MNFKVQRRILLLGTIITLSISSGVFTYFIHSKNEATLREALENKLKGDGQSVLAHLYLTGNEAWFVRNLESYKSLGVTCLGVKDTSGTTIWGNSHCDRFLEARNYIDQKVLDITYTLPETTIISTIQASGFSFLLFFMSQLIFLSVAYIILNKLMKKHSETLAKNKISRTMAHNLRSPLAALHTLHELAKDKLNDSEKEILSAVYENVNKIVSNLIEQKTIFEPSSTVDISKAVKTAININKLERQSLTSLEIASDLSEGIQTKANYSELVSIISNLLNNSIEARKPSSPIKIKVSAYREKGTVVLKVWDNGVGIKEEALANLFKYGQTTKSNGKGCGLHHAKELITAWDGEISITSTYDESTEVTITLPLVESPKEIVLIDNEIVNIVAWKGVALKNKIPFKGFTNSNDFFTNLPTNKNDVAVYVDYDLGDENGLDVVLKLKEAGFSHVALATGESHHVDPRVRQVGKEFPLQ